MPRSASCESAAYSPMPSATMRDRGARRMRDTKAVLRTERRSGVRVTAYAVSRDAGLARCRDLARAGRERERPPLDDCAATALRTVSVHASTCCTVTAVPFAIGEAGAGETPIVAIEGDALLGEEGGDADRRGAQDARLAVDGDGDEDGGSVGDGLAVGEGAGWVDA